MKQENVDKTTRESKKGRGRPKYLVKKDCNCLKTHPCPLENKCIRTNVVYKATIKSQDQDINDKFYIGCATDFKERYANHLSTFRNKDTKQECSLKEFVWKAKENNKLFTIEWDIVKQSHSYKAGDKTCMLCQDEKLTILENYKNKNLINKELLMNEKCLHKAKYLIKNWKKTRKT